MSSEKTYDLHGAEGTPFPGFNEEQTYLERVTVTAAADAREEMAEIIDTLEYTPDPQPIHARHAEGEEMLERSDGEFDSGWLECPADHPDAVPFWKDAP